MFNLIPVKLGVKIIQKHLTYSHISESTASKKPRTTAPSNFYTVTLYGVRQNIKVRHEMRRLRLQRDGTRAESQISSFAETDESI